jgi:putative heme-binding domain-containing protein
MKAMASNHRWTRDTAQRLLLEKQDKAAVPELIELARGSVTPLSVRLQAAWTAALLDEAQRPALISLMRLAFPKVRGVALVAAGSEEIHPEELATWFPKAAPAKPVAEVPVITNVNADRQKVVKRYVQEVGSLRGDAKRGEAVFAKACMACHKLGGMGVEVGPDLATVAAKPMDQLLEAIFDPNRAVELRNASTQITRQDGTQIAGLIAAEAPGSVTLKLPGGVEFPVLRRDIKEMKTLKTSLMPEGMESVITAQEAADLLARMTGR